MVGQHGESRPKQRKESTADRRLYPSNECVGLSAVSPLKSSLGTQQNGVPEDAEQARLVSPMLALGPAFGSGKMTQI